MSDSDKVGIEKLDVDNYATWSVKMKFLLITKGLWAPITAQGDVNAAADEKALALIGLFVQDHHLGTVANAKSAKEAWMSLENIYQAKSNARRLWLKRELNSLRKVANEPLTKYVARAVDIRSQLAAAGHDIKEDEVVMSVLAGLPAEYNVVVAVLETSNDALKLDDVLAKLLPVEQRAQASEATSDSKAFFSSKPSKPPSDVRPPYQSALRDSKDCSYCRKKGHVVEECRKKFWDEGHPRRTEPPHRSGYLDNGYNAHYAPANPQHNFALGAANDEWNQEWVLDSGASYHITGNVNRMVNLREPEADITITFGNGNRAKVMGIGNVVLHLGDSKTLTLKEVLYIPESTANLLSIPFAIKSGAEFSFGDTSCIIRVNGVSVTKANRRSNGLYSIRGQVIADALMSAAEETPELWHRRYGHLGYDNLSKLVKLDMVTGISVASAAFVERNKEPCEPCIMAKHHREPFPASESKSNRPLELLHMDLCGPLPFASLGGSKYVATFLDDYTKLSVVRTMAHKSDAAHVVPDVINMLETQSGHLLRIARTDNGGEYISNALADYLDGKGVIHQTTMAYTPQQNGVAERLNRTLMEKTRAMLSDANLPPEMWAEAMVTANYVRNISPVTGKSKTPWELFFGRKPDVSMLRTFGSRAYVHVPKELRNKLDNRSARGIMIGYQPYSKGYRILLDNKKVTTSRDVIFNEAMPATDNPTTTPAPSVGSLDVEQPATVQQQQQQ